MASSSLSDDIEWPQARSKKPLILGLVGVTAVVLIGWLLASGSSDEPSSSATTVEGATTPAAPVDVTPPQRPEPRPTEATPDGGSDEAAPSATTEPSPNKKSGDFADLFEQTAKGSR
jgi:hypothetical protein